MADHLALTGRQESAIRSTFMEVHEGTPLWSFSGSIVVGQAEVAVGWPFASWALTEWIKGNLVRLVSRDTWSSRALKAPAWAERASHGSTLYALAMDDALGLAADISRWRHDIDGDVAAVPAPAAPSEVDEWITKLRATPVAPPPIGPDVVSRAEARAQAKIDTSDLNRWFIFPSNHPPHRPN